MKLAVKSVSIFVCGAAVASLPYTLSLGKAQAQGNSSTSSNSSSKGANSSAQAGSSQFSSSSSSQNSSASDQARKFANAAQNASSGSGSNGGGDMPIMALTNDDQFVYAAQGNVIYKIRKADMPNMTFIPPRPVVVKP